MLKEMGIFAGGVNNKIEDEDNSNKKKKKQKRVLDVGCGNSGRLESIHPYL